MVRDINNNKQVHPQEGIPKYARKHVHIDPNACAPNRELHRQQLIDLKGSLHLETSTSLSQKLEGQSTTQKISKDTPVGCVQEAINVSLLLSLFLP